jgi:hypothetical protein
MRIAEIKLRKIPVQVFFGAVLIDALHAALEDRIIVLDGVAVEFATEVFAALMVDAAVLGKLFPDCLVVRRRVVMSLLSRRSSGARWGSGGIGMLTDFL